ncbi:MAG: hypothetical protein MUF83_00210 [Acidimicrobiales bacterium]|jgi:hypothetical protein|nr:hypothetical protein [Acidimicrobiales bacterium]
MATTTGPGTSGGTNPPQVATAPDSDVDWPRQATDSIVRMVDTVRAKTTGPALSAASIAAYGLTLLILVLPLVVLLLLVLMRATERLFIAIGLEDPIWLVYLLYGGMFCLAGLTLWARRTKPVDHAAT